MSYKRGLKLTKTTEHVKWRDRMRVRTLRYIVNQNITNALKENDKAGRGQVYALKNEPGESVGLASSSHDCQLCVM